MSKKGLTPKRRFPEFRGKGDWALQELGPKTTKVGSGITPTGGEKVYKKRGRPFIRSQNVGWSELLLDDVAYIDEETHGSFVATELRVDDVLLNITGASIGRSAIADSRIAGGNVNQHVCIIRVKPGELHPVLLNQYLVSHDGQKQIDSFQAGGNRQGLNFAQIRSLGIPLPPTLDEQQKIADCLSSLDELIAAEGRKWESLRAYKKGLMQQLFPRDGETVPQRRFPEFRNAEEWKERPLKSLADYENGKAYEQDISAEGRFVVVNSRFVSTDGSVRKYTSADYCTATLGDVLMVLSDLPNGKALAKCFLVDLNDRYAVNQRVARLTPTDVESAFLYYRLNRHPNLLTYDDGLSQTHLSKGNVLDCMLCVPHVPAEQQRIAACLSSLDEQIAAQSRKIAGLKQHKKGLMQQLFPSAGCT